MKNKFHRITHSAGLLLLISTMSKAEAKELIAKASTPEDHHRLAAYFTQRRTSTGQGMVRLLSLYLARHFSRTTTRLNNRRRSKVARNIVERISI